MESEIKRDKTKIKISFLVLEKRGANTNKREERRKEEEEEEDYRYGTTKIEYGYMPWVVWDLSIVLYGSLVLD